MNNTISSSSSGGIGFCGALFIAFLVLKLCKIIDWAWLWIFAPLWIPFALIIFTLVVIGIVALVKTIRSFLKYKKYKK